MGVNTLEALVVGGGYPFFYRLAVYQPAFINTRHFQLPPALHKGKKASNQGKRGQKLIFVCLVLSTPENLETERCKK